MPHHPTPAVSPAVYIHPTFPAALPKASTAPAQRCIYTPPSPPPRPNQPCLGVAPAKTEPPRPAVYIHLPSPPPKLAASLPLDFHTTLLLPTHGQKGGYRQRISSLSPRISNCHIKGRSRSTTRRSAHKQPSRSFFPKELIAALRLTYTFRTYSRASHVRIHFNLSFRI